jgi:fatty acid desaturase
MDTHRDPRLRAVVWKDLLAYRRLEVVHELTLSLPWLAVSLAAAHAGWHVAALAASFVFFLTGLRQAHNAQHYAIGVSRRATEWVLFALSVMMLSSMHAVQFNHLRHHRHCLGDEDLEAMSARMPAWRAILLGPVFPIRLHAAALRLAAPRQRRWVRIELLAIAAWVVVAAALAPWWLRYHLLAMAAGQCFTAFFAVWTVHHDCPRDGVFARTIRRPLLARLFYGMFFHVEHHLFPAVPTRHLPVLAQRLDAVAPEWNARRVF